MTPNQIIAEVRNLIQDTRVTYRYSDAVLLGFVNQTIKRMVLLRPDLFITQTDIATTPNVVEQSLPSTAVRLVEIFRTKTGTAVEEVDRDQFNRAYPAWVNDPAGLPVKYMRHPRNPNRFFVYPRPTAGVLLVGEYVDTPPVYTIDQPISVLSDSYFSVMVDGVVFLAESVDNEYVSSNRAKLFQDSFLQSLGVSLQSRNLIDSESAAAPAPQQTRSAE